MNPLHPGFSDEELHRWVDDRLDPVRAADVDTTMREDPGLATTLRAWRAQRDALAALGRERLDEVMPASMRARIERAIHGTPDSQHAGTPADHLAGDGSGGTGWPDGASVRPPSTPSPTWRIAAAIAVVSAAVLGYAAGRTSASAPETAGVGAPGHAISAESSTPGFVRAAALAHAVFVPEVRHPVEVAADDRAHLVAWLTQRLGSPITAPDLLTEGFELIGGRLLPGEPGPGAQLMYQDAQGLRVTLYLTRREPAEGAGDTAFRDEQSGTLQSFYWIDRGLGHVLSGELPRDRLSALASAVHRADGIVPR